MSDRSVSINFFFFNDTATSEIYTLSLHDALPISRPRPSRGSRRNDRSSSARQLCAAARDRKSTRLNSSHSQISYAVFCLKKKSQRHPANSPKHGETAGGISRLTLVHQCTGLTD